MIGKYQSRGDRVTITQRTHTGYLRFSTRTKETEQCKINSGIPEYLCLPQPASQLATTSRGVLTVAASTSRGVELVAFFVPIFDRYLNVQTRDREQSR